MEIRKIVTVVEEVYVEGFKPLAAPIRVATVMAVIKNPCAGRYVQDLKPMIDEYAAVLGKRLGEAAVAALGAEVEAYGKGALVGLDGEVEHGSGIIHTLDFGNPFRDAAKGKELLPAAEKRGAAGASIDIPLKHKLDARTRSHHQTFEVRIPDAPRADEIVVVVAAASSGRAHPRIGQLKATES